jgi:L-serine dehydratase
MSVELYPEFYNDVFGPVMQPGSSSHTAGPCRLGYLAGGLLGEEPRKIRILLDKHSSFAGTFGLMAEDSAMLAGALGMLPDDPRLYQARKIVRQTGIEAGFEFGDMLESRHPNAIKFILTGASSKTASLVGDSTGGGMVKTQVVNGFPLRFKGDSFLCLLFDPEGALPEAAFEQFAAAQSGLVETGSSTAAGKARMYFLRTSSQPDMQALRTKYPTFSSALLKPVLPVITSPGRKPQLFRTMSDWRKIAQERGIPLWEAAVHYEVDASGWTPEQVIAYMRMIERKMYRQTHAVYEETLPIPQSPFKPDMAGEWQRYATSTRSLSDGVTAETIRLAYGAGAGIPGVEVVAGPMGSGGGYIHAALWAVKEARGFSADDLLRGLFIAAGIGAIAYSRTEPTGERTGCSGETGICGAMAAAAVTEMAGGTPEQVENAASLSLQSATGIPCDPIPGGFGQPCRSRILTAVCMASVFADLALAGRQAVLPLHEAIDVMDAVGRKLPGELLCTSLGGAAAAPAALRQTLEFRLWYEQTEKDGTPRPPGNLI